MQRLASALVALALLAVADSPAQAFQFVSGSGARDGDLVAVWVDESRSFEYIRNLGSLSTLSERTLVSFDVPDEFGNTLEGGRFAAFAVRNPLATFPGDATCVQPNIVLTSDIDPMTVDALTLYLQSNDARPQLDFGGVGLAWLPGLNTVPLPSEINPDVIVNTVDTLVLSADQQRSYSSVLAPGNVDNVGGTITFGNPAVTIPEGDGEEYAIDLYEISTEIDCSDGIPFVTSVGFLGTLVGDNGFDGVAELALTAPEPGATALGGLACLALAYLRRVSPS